MAASKNSRSDAAPGWFVYMLRCADGTLYTGVATDVRRRLREHNGDARLAARYTRARRPVTLIYSEVAADRAAACRRECQIKALSRGEKLQLLAMARRFPADVIEK
jgi:putative endonuclease